MREPHPIRSIDIGTHDLLEWRLCLRPDGRYLADPPSAIVTICPAFSNERMPQEIALLLPTCPGPDRLISAFAARPTIGATRMAGLFLASPFTNVRVDGAHLARAGVRWVTNLPSVEQQDEEFTEQVTDVGLDHRRELANLAKYRELGFRIAPVVASSTAAEAALAIEPDAIVVMPKVGDFAAGFPSLRQRDTAARSVSRVVRKAGWQGLLLGLGESSEMASERLWSRSIDGLVCRPLPISVGG